MRIAINRLDLLMHIKSVRPNGYRQSVCGERGEVTYSPLDADCLECKKIFVKKFPEATAEWKALKERQEANK